MLCVRTVFNVFSAAHGFADLFVCLPRTLKQTVSRSQPAATQICGASRLLCCAQRLLSLCFLRACERASFLLFLLTSALGYSVRDFVFCLLAYTFGESVYAIFIKIESQAKCTAYLCSLALLAACSTGLPAAGLC